MLDMDNCFDLDLWEDCDGWFGILAIPRWNDYEGYVAMKLGYDHYGRWTNKEHTNKHGCVQLHSDFCTICQRNLSSQLHIRVMAIASGSNHQVFQKVIRWTHVALGYCRPIKSRLLEYSSALVTETCGPVISRLSCFRSRNVSQRCQWRRGELS